MRKLAAVIALVGCGRVGFDDLAGPPVEEAPGVLSVVVTGDRVADPAAPVGGAAVFVDRGGALERLATDASGAATFSAAGVVAFHVVYRDVDPWRVYSVALPGVPVIELGGRPQLDADRDMTFVLPAAPGATGYFVSGSTPCMRLPVLVNRPSNNVLYSRRCESQQVHVIGARERIVNNTREVGYLDAGVVTLKDGSVLTVPGSYAALPVIELDVAGLPAAAVSVAAVVVERSALGVASLSLDGRSAIPVDGKARLSLGVVPGGTAVRIAVGGVSGPSPDTYAGSEYVAVVAPAAVTSIDASGLLPMFDSLVLDDPRSIRWGGGEGGQLIAFHAVGRGVEWYAYLDPSATGVAFPALPDDLRDAIPTSFDQAELARIALPDTTANEVARTIHRVWQTWPDDEQLYRVGGASRALTGYLRGLGGGARSR